ncbi:polar amino acid transport system substrate-binding protein [Arthrobacter sp. 49Tsu3.1M3]|uniref:substrate-binding periplasmic protein n=1 Tax=Arthrobacter sp. 49Tsu3.1M3 TaxID=1279029 RepID=UPI0009CE9979|nr:transporter substrate-binding domain-containing protein [Arthrobacter sp. 49Tsu3.1M3]SKB43920.1 polar amino acid transport system substrate-binding protein [Arthrobacter sp. 49Tsu3.1M3]
MKTRIYVTVSAVIAAAAMLSGCASSSASTVSASCTPASTFKTLNAGSLSVVGPDYPPLFTYENQTLGGVDGKILQGFAEANCLTTDTKVLPAASVVETLKGGQADIAAGGWYPTAERAKVVAQSETAYGDPSVLVGKNPSGRIEDYTGKKVGTTQGYLWVDDLVKWGGDNVKLYQSPDAVYQDLVNGRIDVAVMAVNEAAYRLSKSSGSGLSYVSLQKTHLIEATQHPAVTNLPHAKDNPELTAAINSYLDKIRKDGSLAKILQEYGIDPKEANPATN